MHAKFRNSQERFDVMFHLSYGKLFNNRILGRNPLLARHQIFVAKSKRTIVE